MFLRLFFLGATSVVLSASSFSASKFILHGWDLSDTPPDVVAANIDKFSGMPVDGITLHVPPTIQRDGSTIHYRSIMQDPPWLYESLERYEPSLKKIAAHPAIKESFLTCLWLYNHGNRLDWRDDAQWRRFAGNMRMFARLAKRCGQKGLFIDAEDYSKERQFYRLPHEPPYAECARLARQRGREVFSAVFEEFPDAVVLSFWFFSACRSALGMDDPAAAVSEAGQLWPHFINGMLDAMPMSATLVDGDECAYKYDSRIAFNDGAIKQVMRSIPLVAPENRDKFRARMRVGFGQYIDMYVNAKKPGSSWYFGPEGGSRLEHFRRNLSDAAHTAEYVWIYGEKFSWVEWKDDASVKIRRRYSRKHTWESALPGLSDVLAELRDPKGAALAKAKRLRSEGSENLYPANVCKKWTWFDKKKSGGSFTAVTGRDSSLSTVEATGVESGAWHVPMDSVREGEAYVVDLWIQGECDGYAEVIWRTGKAPFNWKLGRFPIPVSEQCKDGRRRCTRILHVPVGVDGLMFRINAERMTPGSKASFEDIGIFKIKPPQRPPRPLFENGGSCWTIAVPDNAPKPVLYAASELADTVHRISGAELKTVSAKDAPETNVIWLKQDGDSLADSFSVDTAPGKIELKGSSPRAVFFAVYAFLRDRLGVRWYWPGKSGEFLPKLSVWNVEKWHKEYKPFFGYREMSICGIPGHRHEDTERWFPKVFLNCGLNTPKLREEIGLVVRAHGHSVSLPENMKLRESLFSSHPEWFSMINGKRDIKGIAGCWSNEGYFNYVVDKLCADITKNKASIAYYCTADIIPRCECKQCTRNPDKSARWWNYYARIIKSVRKRIPNVRFAGLAYQEYRSVPGVSVEDVDFVEYCHYNRCYFHPLDDGACEMNVNSMKEFRKWGEKAPLSFYGYEFDVFKQPMYLPLWNVFADEMKVYRKMGLKRVKTEYPVNMHRLASKKDPLPKSGILQYASRLSAYAWATLAFDPDIAPGSIVDDFCRNVYGKGSRHMVRYHKLWAEAWGTSPKHMTYFFNAPRNFADKLMPKELEKRMGECLVLAAKAAKGDGRALSEIALDAECFKAWTVAAEEARKGGMVHNLDFRSGDDAFNTIGWLESRARIGKSQPTRFKLYRTEKALRILAECTEADIAKLDRGTAKNDAHNWESPTIEMFLDVGDGSSMQFAVTPAGGVWDAKNGNVAWNAGVSVRPSINGDQWQLDMTIPYKGLGRMPVKGERWKLMIIRNADKLSGFKSCGWPINAHRDYSSAATLVFK